MLNTIKGNIPTTLYDPSKYLPPIDDNFITFSVDVMCLEYMGADFSSISVEAYYDYGDSKWVDPNDDYRELSVWRWGFLKEDEGINPVRVEDLIKDTEEESGKCLVDWYDTRSDLPPLEDWSDVFSIDVMVRERGTQTEEIGYYDHEGGEWHLQDYSDVQVEVSYWKYLHERDVMTNGPIKVKPCNEDSSKVDDTYAHIPWLAISPDGIIGSGLQIDNTPSELLDGFVEIPLVDERSLITKLDRLTVHRDGKAIQLCLSDDPEVVYVTDLPYEEVRKLFTKKGV